MNPIASWSFAAIAAASLLSPVPAVAQPYQGAMPPPAAGDGSPGGPNAPGGSGGRGYGRPITLAEYQARFRDRILQADTDHDGRISLAEWTAMHATRGGDGRGGGRGDPARQFQTMDSNVDGYVTPAEIDAVSARRFARLDANHDGVLTPDERMAMRGGRRNGGDGAMGGGEPTEPLPPPQ